MATPGYHLPPATGTACPKRVRSPILNVDTTSLDTHEQPWRTISTRVLIKHSLFSRRLIIALGCKEENIEETSYSDPEFA